MSIRDSLVTKIACGARDCGTVVGEVGIKDEYPYTAWIKWRAGFARPLDGIIRLSNHVRRQWESAKRQRVRWGEFIPTPRRPGPEGEFESMPSFECDFTRPLRFACPCCGRVNQAEMDADLYGRLLDRFGRREQIIEEYRQKFGEGTEVTFGAGQTEIDLPPTYGQSDQ
ncbi:MAG: hypothetical protein ACYC4L_19275 [Chloroflexota bacterium]